MTYEDQPKDIHWALGHPEKKPKKQVAHMDQGIQSVTNHWSTKKGKLSNKGKEAFTFTAQQAEKYQALVASHVPGYPSRVCASQKGVGSQDQSNYTLKCMFRYLAQVFYVV